MNANANLWREAREAGARHGRSLSRLIGASHTVIGGFLSTAALGSRPSTISRLWVEKHGERAAGVIAAILNRPVGVDELFPQWDCPEERPLTADETEMLRETVRHRSESLNPRESSVVQEVFGLTDGEPKALATVAKQMGLTREGVRQIELRALQKLGAPLPRCNAKTAMARRRRARLFLEALTGQQK